MKEPGLRMNLACLYSNSKAFNSFFMKTLFNKSYYFLFLSLFLFNACVPEEEKIQPRLLETETDGWIYSDLILKGFDLNLDCSDNKITLSKDGETTDLEITDCLVSLLIGHIPADLTPGLYSITAEIEGRTFTEIDGKALEIEVISRPVVFPLSSTNLKRGEVFEITGLNLLNPTEIFEFEPAVWITNGEFSNINSTIEVSADGNSASIILDEEIVPGNYTFRVSTKEWSNRYEVMVL